MLSEQSTNKTVHFKRLCRLFRYFVVAQIDDNILKGQAQGVACTKPKILKTLVNY